MAPSDVPFMCRLGASCDRLMVEMEEWMLLRKEVIARSDLHQLRIQAPTERKMRCSPSVVHQVLQACMHSTSSQMLVRGTCADHMIKQCINDTRLVPIFFVPSYHPSSGLVAFSGSHID